MNSFNTKDQVTFDASSTELQLLEFLVGHEVYGINIAKVSEIIRFCELTPMPSAPEAIEGVFMHREKLVTVIDLHKILGMQIPPEHGSGLMIVCDFEQLSVAFHVSMVNGIQRLGWSTIEKPPTVNHNGEGLTTGIAKLENKMIMILDCEKIVCDLNYGNEYEAVDFEELDLDSAKNDVDFGRHIIVAEDSSFLNKVMCDALKAAGFKNLHPFYNGLDAWDYIRSLKGGTNLKQACAAVISDIEMPQMDGHTLTKLIKDDKELRGVPVFIFSSLIHENMRQKGDSAGANAQFSRAQLSDLLKILLETMKS
ncbi:MAG: chemotaxis protein [Oscillospiraceae bacterium]|jgi:two-component system chemotaxis response regulator CheV|nr:chemotaxis protein [Oscillospiraceae bacterium]